MTINCAGNKMNLLLLSGSFHSKSKSLMLIEAIKKYFDKTDKNVDDQNDADIDINDYLDIIAVWYRDALLYKASNDTNHLIFKNGERLNVVMKIADHASYEGIEQVLNAIDRTKTRIAANVNFELALELLFLTIRDNS